MTCNQVQETLDALAKQLTECSDIDSINSSGETALTSAVSDGSLDIVRFLIISGTANVNVRRPSDGATPLCIAATNDNFELLQLLLQTDAEVDARNSKNLTPLGIAVTSGHAGCARLLIEAGADIDCRQSVKGFTPLTFASFKGYSDIVRMLVAAGADVDKPARNEVSALHAATKNNHLVIVEILLNAQVDEEKSMRPALMEACSGEIQQEVLLLLMMQGVDVNFQRSDGSSPLSIAAFLGRSAVVQQLISSSDADCDLQDQYGCSPVYLAAQNGHHRVVEHLVEAGADVDRRTLKAETPLQSAARRGHLLTVQVLIKASANLDYQDSIGDSCLLSACIEGHQAIVDLLLQQNLDLSPVQAAGASSLYLATQNRHTETVRSLTKASADVNQLTKCGQSPLYIAARLGSSAAAQILIEGGVDVDVRPPGRSTALWVAAQYGNAEVVRLLLDAQADPSIPGKDGITAAQVAELFNHQSVMELLASDSSETAGRLRFSTLCSFGQAEEAFEFLLKQTVDSSVDKFVAPGAPWKSLVIDCFRLTQALKPLLQMKSKEHESRVSDRQLSLTLNSRLLQAGFCRLRAVLQASAAAVLEQILQTRWEPKEDAFVVGSFSEGWGNSLVQLNGITDSDSDIDVTHFFRVVQLHLRNRCQCKNVPLENVVDYNNGHVKWSSGTSNPASAHRESLLRPAVDYVRVFRCCCYPEIQLLRKGFATCMPPELLQMLQDQVDSSKCHLATASPPGEPNSYLRVSTTFLERKLMRSFNDVQGQLFIALKYLIKKVISAEASGLKTYHAKTIAFYMLEQTPADEWKPENLVQLIRQALQMLLDNLRRKSAQVNECMRHFFLRDAIVYLKGVGKSAQAKQNVEKVVSKVMTELPNLLVGLHEKVKPIGEFDLFQFHPFLVMPDVNIPQLQSSPAEQTVQYQCLYDLVTEIMLMLTVEGCSEKRLKDEIRRIPDCARSARECLRVMTCLKFGQRNEAATALEATVGHCVSRGVKCPVDMTESDATESTVWQHLLQTDSTWKFFLHFSRPPNYAFLPASMRANFPTQMRNYTTYFYMNFDAMLTALRLELLGHREIDIDWFRRVSTSDCADVQELLVVLEHCTRGDLVISAIQSNRIMLNEDPGLFSMVNEVLSNPLLRVDASRATLEAVRELAKSKAASMTEELANDPRTGSLLGKFYAALYESQS